MIAPRPPSVVSHTVTPMYARRSCSMISDAASTTAPTMNRMPIHRATRCCDGYLCTTKSGSAEERSTASSGCDIVLRCTGRVARLRAVNRPRTIESCAQPRQSAVGERGASAGGRVLSRRRHRRLRCVRGIEARRATWRRVTSTTTATSSGDEACRAVALEQPAEGVARAVVLGEAGEAALRHIGHHLDSRPRSASVCHHEATRVMSGSTRPCCATISAQTAQPPPSAARRVAARCRSPRPPRPGRPRSAATSTATGRRRHWRC